MSNPAAGSPKRNLVITRVFDAPPALVWKAWTDPEHIMRWWPPQGFTSPAAKLDLRVGGKYLYCMRSEDGHDSWATGTFREIVLHERLVYTDSFSDAQGNPVSPSQYGLGDDFPEQLLITVTFEDQGGKTKLTMTHAGLPGGEIFESATAGWNQSLDKLAALLK